MNRFFGGLAGAMTFAMATGSSAGGIDPLPLGYNSSTVLYDNASGSVSYTGPDSLFGEFFDGGLGSIFNVTSLDLDDNTSASFSFNGLASPISGATEITVSTEYVAFFFENASNGFLVNIDVSGQGLDFTDSFADINTDAQVSLTEFSPEVIPLPATLPLILAGLGGLALMGRRTARS